MPVHDSTGIRLADLVNLQDTLRSAHVAVEKAAAAVKEVEDNYSDFDLNGIVPTTVTVTISKTIQVRQYEPVRIELSETANLKPGANPAHAHRIIHDSLVTTMNQILTSSKKIKEGR